MNNHIAETKRKEPSEKLQQLIKLMKELRYCPNTGYGDTFLEINWLEDKINMVKVTTKIKPQ